MRRSRLFLVVTSIAALIGMPATSAEARGTGAPCAKRGSTTIVATTSARVFSTQSGERIHGCLYRTGRRHLLWQKASGNDFVDHSGWVGAIAGRFVAIESELLFEFSVDHSIYVVDLRSGRGTNGASWWYDHGGPDEREPEQVVLRPTGAFAWINRTSSGREVRSVGSGGTGGGDQGGALLDAGPDIARNSLALARARLYWTSGGEPRSTTLR